MVSESKELITTKAFATAPQKLFKRGNMEVFHRMGLLYGQPMMDKLLKSHVLVFGVGGVGGHCVEALARCGIGRFTLVDGDSVSITNINRQAVALHSTIGLPKVDVMRGRVLDIHPGAFVQAICQYYPIDGDKLWESPYDIIVDAIDDIPAKVDIALQAQKRRILIVSSMGAGNKKDPTRFQTADLYETTVCPLARVMRKRCREAGVERLRVVYSKEIPAETIEPRAEETEKRYPGSVAFVTAAAGCVLASEVVKLLFLKN